MIDRIRDLYSRATILALIRRGDSGWDNVYTAVVYGSDLMAELTFGTLSVTVGEETFEAYRVVSDAPTAADFAEEARTRQSATIPGTERHVRYTPDVCFDAFLPRGGFPESETESCSCTYSCWRRRATARFPSLAGTVLDDQTFMNVAMVLPTFNDADYTYLNVAPDLTRLQTLDEVLPVPLTLDVRGGAEMSFEVGGYEVWRERFSPLSMTVDTYDFGLRVGSYHVVMAARSGTIPLEPASAVNAVLSGDDGMLLDQGGGVFIRQVGINVGITPPPLDVRVGSQVVRVPVAPRNRQQTIAGDLNPLPNLFTRRALAKKWRELLMSRERFSERVFDGREQSGCRARGISLLSEMVRTTIPGSAVRVIDPFALDAQALMAITPIAAGIPDTEIWILTESKRPCGEDVSKDDVAAFKAVAAQVARLLGAKIRVFEPTIPLHDRFLQIGSRTWHVGHSFNRFGCDLSAIVELTDPYELRALREVMDSQFVGGGELFK